MSLQSMPHAGASEPGWLLLVKAVEQLAAADEFSDIIDTVRETARDISGADGVCVVLRDGDRCHYVDENAIAPLWKGKRFPINACVSGWCMLHDQTAVVPDVYDDERVPIEAYRPTFIKSMVVVPIRTHEPIGAIGFYWGHERSFPDETLALIEALGRSTSATVAAVIAREEAQESAQRLAMALRAGGLGAFDIDLTDGTMHATPGCKAIFGRRAEDPFSRDDLLAAVDPADREVVAKILSLAPQVVSDAVYRLPLPVGTRHIELKAQLIFDVDGSPVRVAGVVRDVTERFHAKERFDALAADMLRASRLNDLGAMASALAHELNQPLAAGSNYLKAAERLLAKDPDKAVEAMSKAGGQFLRTKEIIQRIRGFVGQGNSARSRESVSHILTEVLELARITTRRGDVKIDLDIAPGLPGIDIDKVQIQQVLFNLLRNAAEAMEGRPKRKIRVRAIQKGEMIELRVCDSGPGLAPEIAEHLFQPFHTTKEGGMGVGLSLCRKIVDSHGGKLWYENPEVSGQPGATFAFSLPAAPQ